MSDKDTCCFCFPLWLAVIIIGCIQAMEVIGAFVKVNIVMIILSLFNGICFIVAAVYRKNICARRTLAAAFTLGFALECLIFVYQVAWYYGTDQPLVYCEELKANGKLHWGTSMNECE